MSSDTESQQTLLERAWDSIRSVECEECGESSLPEDWEREPVGTGFEAFRCPNCGEITA